MFPLRLLPQKHFNEPWESCANTTYSIEVIYFNMCFLQQAKGTVSIIASLYYYIQVKTNW